MKTKLLTSDKNKVASPLQRSRSVVAEVVCVACSRSNRFSSLSRAALMDISPNFVSSDICDLSLSRLSVLKCWAALLTCIQAAAAHHPPQGMVSSLKKCSAPASRLKRLRWRSGKKAKGKWHPEAHRVTPRTRPIQTLSCSAHLFLCRAGVCHFHQYFFPLTFLW